MSRFRCAVLAVAAVLAIAVAHEMPHSNSPSFLLDASAKSTFAIPIQIGIGLIGFSGDGAGAVHFAADELSLTLQNSLPALRPNCLQTGAPLNVQYKVDYNVRNFPTATLHQIEMLIHDHMKYSATIDGILTYDIEITEIEDAIDALYSAEFGRDERVSGSAGLAPGPATDKSSAPYAMLILNPSKTSIRPVHASSTSAFKALPFQYRYRYESGAATQVWVAKHRYVVVDLTAGPCEYGVTDSGEGTVSRGTIPVMTIRKPGVVPEIDPATGAKRSPAQIEAERKKQESAPPAPTVQFQAQLASVVVSAVRHIFVTDVRYEHVAYAEKLIVPIVVFRNHRRFDPFMPVSKSHDPADSVHDFFIDVTTIRAEIKKMLLPHQELLLVTGTHEIEDHHHIATAMFKAIRADTIHSVGSDGVYRAKVIPHVDSAILEEEMKHAVDSLTTGLLHSNGLGSHIPPPSTLGPSAMAPAAPGTSSHGHRILPVYVFSLLGMDKSLLFDHRHVSTASSSAVMVLQTGNSAIPLPYFSENGIIHVNARMPTRHIVAGLATAIGGLMNPFERYSNEAAGLVHDYLWSNGHHPFGPFSATPRISDLFVDAGLRNSIISRVEHSLDKVRKAVKLVDQFTNEYVRDPYGDTITYEDSNFDSILEFWSSKTMSAQSPLAGGVVTRLEHQLSQLSSDYEQLAKHFQSYELDSANTLSGSIDLATTSFVNFVNEEIGAARHALKCCAKEHHVSPQAVAKRASLTTFLAIILCGLCVGTYVYGLVAPAIRRPAGAGYPPKQPAAPAYRFGGTTVGVPNTAASTDRSHRY